MELHAKITINKSLQNDNSLARSLMSSETKDEAIQQLSEQSNISVNFLTLHYDEVRRFCFEYVI